MKNNVVNDTPAAINMAQTDKSTIAQTKSVVIYSFDNYNFRRCSTPWVALINNGKYDFNKKIGGYTGRYNSGDAGDVYVSHPVDGQIYAYGQKDYRNPKNTFINFAVWQNGQFVECDKLGRVRKGAL